MSASGRHAASCQEQVREAPQLPGVEMRAPTGRITLQPLLAYNVVPALMLGHALALSSLFYGQVPIVKHLCIQSPSS